MVDSPRPGLAGLLRSRLFHDLLIVCAVYAPIRYLLFPAIVLPKPFELPEQAYLSSFVALEALTYPPAIWWFVVNALLVVAHFVPHAKNPFAGKLRWGTTEAPGARWLLLGLGLPIAWKLTTYDVNLYFDQVHMWDRLLIGGLYIGMTMTPLAIPFFIGFSAALFSQFHYPDVFHFTWADKAVLYYGLLLVWMGLLVSKFRRLDATVIPSLMLCLFAAFYLYPGIAKVSLTHRLIDWFLYNPVHELFVASWLHGWWGNATYEQIAPWYEVLRAANLLSTGFTMAFEFGMVVILLHRWLPAVFLVGAVVFHTTVLLASGILFWEWWAPELAMLGLLATRWRKPDVAHIFTRRERFLSPLLIICAMPVFWPYALGWLDSPYTIVYDLEVREEGSETWLELNRGDMDPYNLPFTQNRFPYLIEPPMVKTGSYGAVVDPDLQHDLMVATSVEDVRRALEPHAYVQYNADDAETFARFLARYFVHENERGNRTNVVPGMFESLHHQYAHSGVFRPVGAPPVTHARLRAREMWHDGSAIHTLSDTIVIELAIPDEAPAIP